jgi:hypothetical protein
MSKNFIIHSQDGEHSTAVLKATKPIMSMLKNSISSNATLVIDSEIMEDSDSQESSSILDAIMEKEYYILIFNHLHMNEAIPAELKDSIKIFYSCGHSSLIALTREELFSEQFADTFRIEAEDYIKLLSVIEQKQYLEVNKCHQINGSPANFTMFKNYKQRKEELEIAFQQQLLSATITQLFNLESNQSTVLCYYFSDERIEQPNTDCFAFSYTPTFTYEDFNSELSELAEGDETLNRALGDLLDNED